MSSDMTDSGIWNAYLMYCNGVEPKKPQQILLWSKKENAVPTLKFGDSQRIFKAFVGKGVTLNPNTVNKLLEKTDITPTSNTSTTPISNKSTPTTSSKPIIKENERTIVKKKVKSRKRTSSTEEMPQSVNWIKSQPPKKSNQGGVLKKTHSRRNSVEPLKIDSGSGQTILSAYFKNKNIQNENQTQDEPQEEEEEQQQPPQPPQPPQPVTKLEEEPKVTQTLPPPPPNVDNTPQQEEEIHNEVGEEEEDIVPTKLPPPPPTNTESYVNDEEQQEEEVQVSKPPVNPLFAQLQQGTDITSGLKKVTDDMKTKNRKDRSGIVKSILKKPQNKKLNVNNNNNKQVEKPAKFSKEGNKFIAEYYKEGIVEFNEAKMINEVWVMNSKNSNYLVKNKVKNVLISDCNKIEIEIRDVITTLEVVNCNNVKLYIKGSVPSIQLDKCYDPTLILFKEALDTKIPKIISSLCSNLEIQMPNKDNTEEWNTMSVPYQFETTIDPETKKMVTIPVNHN